MALANSAMIWARPVVRRSTVWRSARWAGPTVSSIFDSATGFILMCHEVKQNIDSERVGSLLREFMEEAIVFAFALPAVAVIAVVGGNDHDPTLIVVNDPDMHVFCAIRHIIIMVVLPSDAEASAPGVEAVLGLPDVGSLQFV